MTAIRRRLQILAAAIHTRNQTSLKCKMKATRSNDLTAETTIAPSCPPQFPTHQGEPSPFERAVRRIFLGPDGLRPIWRLAAAVGLYSVLAFVIEALLAASPAIWAWIRSHPRRLLTPATLLFSESIRVLAALLTGYLMLRIENRSFRDYGLGPTADLGRRFLQGAVFGFLMLTALILSIGVMGGFAVGGLALDREAAIRFGLLYALAFLLVGFFEEATFRGYMQATLAEEIGFWPAAVALSFWFGLIHLHNPGEGESGLLLAGCFGLLAAFSLRRTGSIWFAIGMHAAWDWGESYFYGVPDSGVAAVGHLTSASLHGPAWLTGGSVGPEGSVLVFAVIGIGALAVNFLFPAQSERS